MARTNKKTYTVDSKPGLNVREQPDVNSKVLRVLSDRERVVVDIISEVPEGWKLLLDGGYVMTAYLK